MGTPKLRRHAPYALILVFFAVAGSSAQQDSTKATTAIHAGRLIDVRTGGVTANTYITIAKDRIVGISDSIPADIPIVDLSK